LIVGITGHRPNRMPENEWPRIRQSLADVMAAIARSHGRRSCRLVTGLAEGADRLAAFVALGLGWPVDALLAFHRSRFEEDFPQASAIGEFRALLAAAATVAEPALRWHVGRPAEDGYDAMGAAMLARCQILIAIWDGQGSRGKGGTIEVIDAARRRGHQVHWIHATEARPPRKLAPKAVPAKKRAPARRGKPWRRTKGG
jgi:hypothetical protein